MGNDTPLYNHSAPEKDAGKNTCAIADEINLPLPIKRQAFDEEDVSHPKYYREGKSFVIWAPGWPTKNSPQPVPRELIDAADLSGWQYKSSKGRLLVDPELGRIAFPPKQLPKKVWVSYHYGFSADIGGGEYLRTLAQPASSTVIKVSGQDQLQNAIKPWQAGQTASDQPVSAVIEIVDSGVYVLPVNVGIIGWAQSAIARCKPMPSHHPFAGLADRSTDSLSVTGAEDSHFVLDGILIEGRGVLIEGAISSVQIRHCTLVPGWSVDSCCEPCRPAEPSVNVINSQVCITIQHSIVGSIQINNDEVRADPLLLRISDSVVDATGWEGIDVDCTAIGMSGAGFAHATVSIARCTVLGTVATHAISLAENSIFMGEVCVARRQIGCMRFCYVPPDSRTPRRYHCQPDEAINNLSGEQINQEQLRVRPQFNSTRYGTPTYCQLAKYCADEIMRGADDMSEMGVFHDLFQAQRLANLRTRLQEFTPAGADVNVILAT